ncbi:hypothetical protein TYRP_003743 [Tyrophagus putrescentiae]|nr:hypothetical protein TYRP_003743 [Tyrophagus putrescentiae]
MPAAAAAIAGATVASFAVQTPTRTVMPPPLLVIAPAGALCCDGEDHHKSRRRSHQDFSHSLALRMAPTTAHRAEDHHHHLTTRASVSMLMLFIFPSFLLLSFPGQQPMASRAPGPTTTRMDGDQDGGRPGPTTTRTEGDQDGRQPEQSGWTTGMDGNEDRRLRRRKRRRRRRLKTEDRRRGEEAGNRTVALPKRQSTLAVDLLKRSGPSRYYCPSSDVGGPKRTVDKDGRLSEDGEADGNTKVYK